MIRIRKVCSRSTLIVHASSFPLDFATCNFPALFADYIVLAGFRWILLREAKSLLLLPRQASQVRRKGELLQLADVFAFKLDLFFQADDPLTFELVFVPHRCRFGEKLRPAAGDPDLRFRLFGGNLLPPVSQGDGDGREQQQTEQQQEDDPLTIEADAAGYPAV